MTDAVPARYVRPGERESRVPVNVVWEITMACDLACQHCGSRSGRRRPGELTTDQALAVVQDLARMGVRDVALIGGEAYLRKDWLDIVRAIRAAGMECGLQTGGRNLNEARIIAARDAGLQGIGVSIDGLPPLHDRLRGVPGSFERAMKALELVASHGLVASVNTQINAESLPQLRQIMDLIIAAGAVNWQLAITVAMGGGADHPELLLQPWQMLEVVPLLCDLADRGRDQGLTLQIANNIGYFGPHESLLRNGFDPEIHWQGCSAGENVMGIESDGTVKACPGLSHAYAGGRLTEQTLEAIWNDNRQLGFNRYRRREDLWGHCRDCYYAETCMGGCTWTAHALFGKPGNNPMCYYRAAKLAAAGKRERLVRIAPAPGLPFDHGLFEIIEEDWDQAGQPRINADADA